LIHHYEFIIRFEGVVMKRGTIAPARRGGFTLIELLVVIAIIAILGGLITGAAARVRVAAQRAQVAAEIAQLDNAVSAFKTKFNVGYIPSKFTIKNNYTLTGGTTADDIHFAYLKQLFPQISSSNTGYGSTQDFEGIECLVFFLSGGDKTGYTGFSINRAQPFNTGGDRIGPFFDFNQKRLSGSGKVKYVDVWDTPYAYFTSINGNDYEATDANRSPLLSTSQLSVSAFKNGGRFERQKSCQIISAGPNLQFGPGGDYTASNSYKSGGIGADDLSSFAQAGNLQQP
jgi:prepilin-type N-terminal cleavage/methylation domain-containing protein